MTEIIKGNRGGGGIGFGTVVKYQEVVFNIDENRIPEEEIQTELDKLVSAVNIARNELIKIKERTIQNGEYTDAAIMEAQIMMLDDPELHQNIKNKVLNLHNVTHALYMEKNDIIESFEKINDAYLRARKQDINDVLKRVLYKLEGHSTLDLTELTEPSIIVAKDLPPSIVAQLDKTVIKGIVLENGSENSHTAIIAMSHGIPLVSNVKNALRMARPFDMMIVDGDNAEVIFNASISDTWFYLKKQSDKSKASERLAPYRSKITETKDKKRINLGANVSTKGTVDESLDINVDQVGLFRTEFVYMSRSNYPSEEEQLEIYKDVAKKMDGKPVTFRTLDVGGDKYLPYYDHDEETNPFLGTRGIRFSLMNEHVFRTQMRAFIRASEYGDVRVMFPMVNTVREFKTLARIFAEEEKKLGLSLKKRIPLGIMIETPAAAMHAEYLAKHADFFSIGSNDLTQFVMAADRMNPNVSSFVEILNPGLLKLIHYVIKCAHKENIEVGLCGELAHDRGAIPILLGLGVDSLSVHPSHVLQVRKFIHELDHEKLKAFERHIYEVESESEMMDMVAMVIRHK